MAVEKLGFQAEVSRLLQIVANSLYSEKQVFLRELISNACDAIDKVRFEGLNNPEMLDGESDWKISIRADQEAKTLTISDNGIGMSRDSVIETSAPSPTPAPRPSLPVRRK